MLVRESALVCFRCLVSEAGPVSIESPQAEPAVGRRNLEVGVYRRKL